MTVSFQSALCVPSVTLTNEIFTITSTTKKAKKKKEFRWFFSYLKVAKCLQTNSSSVDAFDFNAGRFLTKREQKRPDWVIIVAY